MVLFAATAHAETPNAALQKLIPQLLSTETDKPAVVTPKLAITNSALSCCKADSDWMSLLMATGLPMSVTLKQPVIAVAADGTTAWIATDFSIKKCQPAIEDTTGDSAYYEAEYCAINDPKAWLHGAFLFEHVKQGWQPVAWHVYGGTPKATNVATYRELQRNIEPDAAAAAKLFEASIGDPKELVKTLATRKDLVLFGSEKSERFVGVDKVRATLTKWNLALKPRDGVAAGVAAGKTVAWVAANVDATNPAKPKAKATPYRVLFLYEKKGDGWQLVQASFSAVAGK